MTKNKEKKVTNLTEFYDALAEKLDELFPKSKCKQRGEALVLFAFANIYAEQLLRDEAYKEGAGRQAEMDAETARKQKQKIVKEIEKRKKAEFAEWQEGNYKAGYLDALENLKLWLLERKNET